METLTFLRFHVAELYYFLTKMPERLYTLEELVSLHSENKLRRKSSDFEKKNAETQQASSSYANVHIFDGSLRYTPTGCFEPKYKLSRFTMLDSILLNPRAKAMVAQISANSGNMDYANKIDASELLADILSRKMSIDVFLLLEEQLADNYMLGTCPSGRNVRLIQIYNILDDLNK